MTDISELGERVATAEERFRFINEIQNKHSERLLSLLNKLKADLDETRRHHALQEQEITRLSENNETLRSLLHSLLKAVEAFDSSEPLRKVERQAAGLLSDGEGGQAGDAETGRVGLEIVATEKPERAEKTETVASGGSEPKVEGTAVQSQKKPKIPTFFLRDETDSESPMEIKKR